MARSICPDRIRFAVRGWPCPLAGVWATPHRPGWSWNRNWVFWVKEGFHRAKPFSNGGGKQTFHFSWWLWH